MSQIVQNLQQDSFKRMYVNQGVKYLGLFGSFARGENSKNSDIDLLIDFNVGKSLFDLAEIKIYLQDKLGKKVDLTMKNKIKKSLEPYIKKDLIDIYEKN